MTDILIFYLALGAAGMFLECGICCSFCNGDIIYPSTLYSHTKMNKAFCWICFVLISLFSPLMATGKMFLWISHIGRKNNKKGAISK